MWINLCSTQAWEVLGTGCDTACLHFFNYQAAQQAQRHAEHHEAAHLRRREEGDALQPDLDQPVTVEAELLYRKFDTALMKNVFGDEYVNELPVITVPAPVRLNTRSTA